MQMSSLENRFADLERKLKNEPLKLNSTETLPFMIFHYNPEDEWRLRRMVNNLGIQLENEGKHIVYLSMEKLLWEALEGIEQDNPIEGYHAVVELEKDSDYLEAQDQIVTYFSDNDRCPLVEKIAERLEEFDPENHIVFFVHVAAMSPDLYQMHGTAGQIGRQNDGPEYSVLPRITGWDNGTSLYGYAGSRTNG